MATAVVYRSARLVDASAADIRQLTRLGVTEVLDLRTPDVARRSPDPAVPGATNRLVNLFAVARASSVSLGSVAEARTRMRAVNVAFVTDPAQRARTAVVLRSIAKAHGPVLIHCTEGKDRTGWISAVLQLVAGVDRSEIVAEYLKSNDYRRRLIAQAYQQTLASSGARRAAIQRATLVVESSYLTAGLSALESRYGSVDRYLAVGLGLDAATIAALRARLIAG